MSVQSPAFLSFCVFVVSVLSAKILHIYIHARSVSFAALIAFFPTLFLTDFLLIGWIWLLCFGHRGLWATIGSAVIGVLAVINYGAASMNWGFYCRTGGEIEWKTSLAFASDPKGLGVLMSEAHSVLIPAVVILAVSWALRNVISSVATNYLAPLHRPMMHGIDFVRLHINRTLGRSTVIVVNPQGDRSAYEDPEHSDCGSSSEDGNAFLFSEKEETDVSTETVRHWQENAGRLVSIAIASIKIRILFIVAALCLLRPDKPYAHLSNTLPLQLLEVFAPASSACSLLADIKDSVWPLPELIAEKYWMPPAGDFPGWAPGESSAYVKKYLENKPAWLPEKPVDGFYRWQREEILADPDATSFTLHRPVRANDKCAAFVDQLDDYNPVNDPLRITNLDLNFLEPLRKTFKDHEVVINHIVVIEMESIRKELFPLVPNSPLHEMIMETNAKEDWDSVNEKLDLMSKNTRLITGHFGSFTDETDSSHNVSARDLEMGGINVNNAMTGSSFSFKSFVGSHCGVWPLPANMLEETYGEIYQPCLPHIFNLFNEGKDKKDAKSKEMVDRKWKSVYLQSITQEYDRQAYLNKQIGFEHIVAKEQLDKDPDFEEEEINYFGYPERAIKPHMREAFQDAIDNNERLFLSHFTSTTHHPWATPEDFEDDQYMGDGHKDFNQHLNSIRFYDEWLGEILDLIEEMGVSNETLVVYVGDHATSFDEDGPITNMGPFENRHISNWRVPLGFRHPNLPRIQLDVNATSISILPTILDLLIQTKSLSAKDSRAAADLAHEYEGQSLIRPYRTHQHGRRSWNFGIVNSGGGMILITSADTPWKLALPLHKELEYSFVDLGTDPQELHSMEAWVFKDLVLAIKIRHGEEAAAWAVEAHKVIPYFVDRQHRLWKYAD